jgi:hypothetical protein
VRLTYVFVASAVGVIVAGCAPSLPARVRVSLVDAQIGPGKVDGSHWDGAGTVPPSVTSGLLAALGAPDPYAAVVNTLSSVSANSLDRPEPVGTAELFTAAGPGGTLRLNADRDTFTPIWFGTPTWERVPLEPATRIRVTLRDRDVMFDDPMGVAEIGYSDLVAALRAGRVYPVRVAEQTYRQILFVGISVLPVAPDPGDKGGR